MTDIKLHKNYIIDITGMTHEGQGVGRIQGFTVFVDGAIPGEKAEVRIETLKKSYAVGKLINLHQRAEDRCTHFCPQFEQCGGCALQHMTYEAQLRFKTNTVKDNLRRIGKLENITVHETLGMDKPLYYRNKVQYPVGMAGGKPVIGFYAPRSHDIIPNLRCGIQTEISDNIKDFLEAFLQQHHISVYDEKTGWGLVRHLMTRVGFTTGEVMVVLVINGQDLPKKDLLVQQLTARFPAIKTIVLNSNTRNTNIILGDRNVTLYGDGTITDNIGPFRFKISPLSFFQVNPVQTRVLYEKALEYAGLEGSETVFDLYCGIGTISLFLSQKAKKVYGVEVVEDAIRDACENARINEVDNAEFIVGEAERVIPDMYAQGVRADVVVVDPPRKGCDERLLQTLVDMQPRRIVYVSCNPSTLARDLKFLGEHGFAAREVQPVDMFPWTAHVETIIKMTKCGSEGK